MSDTPICEEFNPFLSIAIPTYNRCEKLIECINMLAREILPLAGFIEIVVSDNCSTDATESAVREWARRNDFCKLSYYRNDKNIGVDGNCHSAIKRSTGKFVWLFCDDDRVLDGGVAKVYEELKKNEDVGFCYVNYRVVVKDVIESSSCTVNYTVRTSGEELFLVTRFAVSFATSCIFLRSAWASVNPEKYIGTYWYHMFAVRDMLPKCIAIVIGSPVLLMNGLDLVTSRREKIQTERTEVEFYIAAHLNFLAFVNTLPSCGYSPSLVKKAKDIAWKNNLRQIFYYKATTPAYNLSELMKIVRKMAEYLRRRPAFWLFHIPTLFLPSFVSGNIYWIISALLKRHKIRLRMSNKSRA